MKRIRLLMFLLSLIVGGGSVWAQDWTASEVGTGNYYLYNVGKGQFLTRGNGWGTQASVSANSALTVTLEEYNGTYKLRTNVNGDGKGLERLGDPVIYTDQSSKKNSTWTFTKVDDASNGPVYTIVSADNHGGGSGSYMTANADNTIVGPADAVSDDYGRWQLVQSWITNSIPVNDANGWTTSQTPTFDGSNVCAEYWNKSGASIKQTLTSLPAGSYELIAVALTRTGMKATLYAGANSMNIATASTSEANNRGQAKDWFNAGNGVNSLEFTHAGGNLEVGLIADNTTGDHWLVWRSFVLLYKGLDLSELKAALQNQIDAVSALEGTTTTAAYNAAKNYADGIDMDAMTTEEAISTASTELANLVNAATALQTNYARYNTIKTAALAIATSLDTTTPDAALDAATTNDAVEAAIATLRATLLAELPNLEIPQDPGYIDVTSVMVDNASVRSNTDYWTKEGTPNGSNSFGKCANNECEFYAANFKFYQTLALNRGTWEFGVTGFHRAGNHTTHFYAGEDKILIPGVESTVVNTMAQAETYFDGGNGKVALKFVIEEAQNVEIGINNQDTETDKWTIFRDFTLKYYGAPDYSVYDTQWSEAVDAANEALEAQAYKYVSGSEKTAVTDAIADAPDGSSKANYLEKIQALEAATATFKAAASSYNAWVLAKTKTQQLWGSALGVADPTTAAEAAAGINALNVAVYDKVKTEYSYPLTTVIGDFTSWTRTAKYTDAQGEHDDIPQTLNTQHWSGVTSAYYEQGEKGWAASNGFNCTYTKTATLPEGNYVLKVAARASGSVTGTISATATDNTVALPNVGAASKGIDLSGAANFGEGEFANGGVGYGWEWRFLPFTLAEDGEVTLTITASTTATNNWFSLADAVLLSDSEKFIPATAEDYTALNTAIEAAAAHTLGFEDGEYAPYNNIEALATLAAAQAIDQDAQNTQEDVQAATAAINALEWVANEGEVNAVYDGTFAATNNNEAPAGWRSTKNGAFSGQYMPRVFNNDDRLTEFNETKSAFFIRFDGTNSDRGTLYYYGDTENYTMPLKANTRYYVKADVKGWGSTGKPQRMNIGGPAGFSGKYAEVTLSNKADTDDADPQQLFIAFTTTVAGNYTISFQCPGSDDNKHNAVVSNIELKKVPQLALNDEDGCDEAVAYADVTVTRTIKAGAWNSFTVPFDMDVPEGWTVKELTDAVDFGKYLKLEFEDAEAIKAGVPYMVKLDGEENVTEFEAEGVSVSPTLNNVVIKDVATMKGNMAPTTVPTGAFFISNNTWYEAAEAQPVNIKAFRAYIELSEEATARGIMGIFSDLEGDVTGINSVNATEKKFDGTVYDLSGRKVAQPARGLYIVNGKKVVIK